MTENLKHSIDRVVAAEESHKRLTKVAKTEELEEGEEESGSEQESRSVERSMTQNPRIQRYLVAVEYIGTRFSGSQQQLNRPTVVGALEEAFHTFIGQPVSIYCGSRTDTGVHALSNVCHVDVERISKRKPGEVLPPHEPGVVRRAVNYFLKKYKGDVMVVDVRAVPNDFSARYNAQERTYFYRLLSGMEPLSVHEKDRAWHTPKELDIHAMKEACKILVGCHDFSSFRSAGCQANSPIRTLDELSVSEVPSTPYFPTPMERALGNSRIEGTSESFGMSEAGTGYTNGTNVLEFGMRKKHRCIVITARARSFLYHQVRLLVGVLKCVGTGELTVSDVRRILDAKTNSAAKPMAPACGLYLGHVKYDFS